MKHDDIAWLLCALLGVAFFAVTAWKQWHKTFPELDEPLSYYTGSNVPSYEEFKHAKNVVYEYEGFWGEQK